MKLKKKEMDYSVLYLYIPELEDLFKEYEPTNVVFEMTPLTSEIITVNQQRKKKSVKKTFLDFIKGKGWKRYEKSFETKKIQLSKTQLEIEITLLYTIKNIEVIEAIKLAMLNLGIEKYVGYTEILYQEETTYTVQLHTYSMG